MFPNIAWPLTLRTSPSDYATFNQIKSFLIFNIGFLLERVKKKKFHFMLPLLDRGGFRQKLANVSKNFQTLVSNDPGLKFIDEGNV